ncbi:MAG: hypothetical protein RL572_1987 [Pseudomonadota bacterium]|jgi:glycine/D-amino acid oxidase-like deaminating enzyme
MQDPASPVQTDIVIFGGGIAGLWLLNRLRQQGLDVVLLECDALGGGQTLASQGIIHGGLKYALNGVLSPASSAIAAMPERWRQCLAGAGEIDLRGVRVLAPHYFMWSGGGYRSRLKSFLGSKALRGRIDALKPAQYPPFFQGRTLEGALYQLTDFVVDTPSLVERLAAPHRERIFQVAADAVAAELDESGALRQLRLRAANGATVALHAQRYILAAGEGNATLMQRLGGALQDTLPAMQTRPLHMVYLRLPHPAPAFVHCIGDSFGMSPRLTITAHPPMGNAGPQPMPTDMAPDGTGWTWYLGGEIAESGLQRSAGEQQAEAARQLQETFPWLDLSQARWGSFFINRAEPRLPTLQRPDTACLHAAGSLLVTWPTKLTLSPDLGDSVCAELLRQGVTPRAGQTAAAALAAHFPFPGYALARWESTP